MASLSNRVQECEQCGRMFNAHVNDGTCPACAAAADRTDDE